ncbi:TPA: hypothetical protein DDW35_13895, partial [Candidatus Sumerlaeota bacterium]|nr:hypothetical protein [Candidatus Sumerlaeota bacterium]
PGFLEQAKREWVEKAEYDEKNKVITIVDRATTCNCPAVQKTAMPGAYCQCSLGWQKYAYSTIVGKPVDVVVVESILRGGKRCAFKITI